MRRTAAPSRDTNLHPKRREAIDAINRLPQTGAAGRLRLKCQFKEKLMAHKQYIERYGEDLPEVRNWKWGATSAGETRR